MEDQSNYGSPKESCVRAISGDEMSARDEQTWSVLSHLSVFVNVFTGFLGPVVALIVWLVYKDRSQKVAFHALQSLWNQIVWAAILIFGWVVTVFLTLLLVGILLIPVILLLMLVPLAQGAWAAYKTSQGVDYRYPLISGLVAAGATDYPATGVKTRRGSNRPSSTSYTFGSDNFSVLSGSDSPGTSGDCGGGSGGDFGGSGDCGGGGGSE